MKLFNFIKGVALVAALGFFVSCNNDDNDGFVKIPKSEAPAVGDGKSEATAYEIRNLANLLWMAEQVNTGALVDDDPRDGAPYFRLTSNITLGRNIKWQPIGSTTHPFTGSFDGGGHYIDGVMNFAAPTVSDDGASKHTLLGFFGAVYFSTIKNLHMDADFVADMPVLHNYVIAGGVAAFVNEGKLENCTNDEDISIAHLKAVKATVGGVVGMNHGTSVVKCKNDGDVRGSLNCVESYVGGISGSTVMFAPSAEASPFADCFNDGDVVGGSGMECMISYTGGIVGNAFDSEMRNCKSDADIVGGKCVAEANEYACNTGGLIGRASHVVLHKNATFGSIRCTDFKDAVGTLVGLMVNEGVVYDCNSTLLRDIRLADGSKNTTPQFVGVVLGGEVDVPCAEK